MTRDLLTIVMTSRKALLPSSWQLCRLKSLLAGLGWGGFLVASAVCPSGAAVSTWGDRIAAVGFTAFAGESSMAGQPKRTLSEAPPDAIETVTTNADTPWVYLDRPALRALGSRPSRLFGKWTEALWSTFFDGVVVFREETAPLFDRP